MKALRTYKLKITSKHQKFNEFTGCYLQAANWLSLIIFKRHKTCNPNSLSKEFYATIRDKFSLPSQLTCSLFRHVVSTYRSMRSNHEWSLAVYKRVSIPLVWKRDFNERKKGISIWGELISFQTRQLPSGHWSDSKLKKIKGQWYLCLVIEIDVSEPKTTGGIIGVDRGQKNILCAVDTKSNKTLYIKGNELSHRRLRIRQIRKKVASVGTRSAHRLLQRLSGREKVVTQNILHIASKQLVAFAQSVNANTIVFENLLGFKNKQTKDNQKLHHKQRARNNRWPYALLEFFTTYKAAAVGIGIDHVPARNTSRGCPKCGHVSKSNRNGLEFRCLSCGFTDNADRVGGTNVSLRLLFQRQAVEERAMCQLAYSSGENQLQAPTLKGTG